MDEFLGRGCGGDVSEVETNFVVTTRLKSVAAATTALTLSTALNLVACAQIAFK
jgi:hypothetical protein